MVQVKPKRTKNYKDIEEAGYELNDRMRRYVEYNYPNIDVDGTFELFRDNCLANDRIYASWDAAFRNWLRKPADWGGFAYKEGMSGDPTWRQLLIEAKEIGFRKPRLPMESASQYRQALRSFVPDTDLLGGRINVTNILKKMS